MTTAKTNSKKKRSTPVASKKNADHQEVLRALREEIFEREAFIASNSYPFKDLVTLRANKKRLLASDEPKVITVEKPIDFLNPSVSQRNLEYAYRAILIPTCDFDLATNAVNFLAEAWGLFKNIKTSEFSSLSTVLTVLSDPFMHYGEGSIVVGNSVFVSKSVMRPHHRIILSTLSSEVITLPSSIVDAALELFSKGKLFFPANIVVSLPHRKIGIMTKKGQVFFIDSTPFKPFQLFLTNNF